MVSSGQRQTSPYGPEREKSDFPETAATVANLPTQVRWRLSFPRGVYEYGDTHHTLKSRGNEHHAEYEFHTPPKCIGVVRVVLDTRQRP